MANIPTVLLTANALRVAQPGYNVLTASVDQFAFNSDFPPLYVFDSGMIEMTNPDYVQAKTTNHFFPQTLQQLPLVIGVLQDIAGTSDSEVLYHTITNPGSSRGVFLSITKSSFSLTMSLGSGAHIKFWYKVLALD